MDVDERIRASRPDMRWDEPDMALLEQVMREPVERRRRRPIALPAAALAAVAAVAAVLFTGSRPDSASAITQAMHWFDPPAGTVLHSEIVNDDGTVREFWQDVDHPERSRTLEAGGIEVGQGSLYDPSTNTIYLDNGKRDVPTGKAGGKDIGEMAERDAAKKAKLDAEDPGRTETRPAPGRVDKPTDENMPVGDPFVGKVRVLIGDHRAAVRGREVHDGVDAWAIALTNGDRAPWTVWVRADNGKPLAFSDPGDAALNKAPESGRWETYEKLDRGEVPLTLQAAHPDATVVTDGAKFDALLRRLEQSR